MDCFGDFASENQESALNHQIHSIKRKCWQETPETFAVLNVIIVEKDFNVEWVIGIVEAISILKKLGGVDVYGGIVE